MPFKTADQNETLKKMISGYAKHMTWWLSPNPGEPYSDVIVLNGDSHLRIKPDGSLEQISQEEYQEEWTKAFRSGMEIDELHRLDATSWEKLQSKESSQ